MDGRWVRDLRFNGPMDAPDLDPWWPLADGELRDTLLAAYAGPGRGYHDVRHLAEVLSRLDELAAGGEELELDLVRLAAWFHDAVYDGGADDETRSAIWAEEALPIQGLTAAEVAEVARLVRLTEHHRPTDDDPSGCALSDADLAILAADPDRYEEYVAGVRQEYLSVPDDQFRQGRAAVLRDLAAKPRIFHTRYACEHWEDAARVNVERELSGLERDTGS